LRYGDENFLRSLEKYVQEGAAVLLEYNQPTIDASLQPLLEKTSFTGSGNKRIIKLTDKPIECHDSFKLFLCNRWREVAFTNDIHDNCCVINFNLTKRSVAELF
jgi:dynein heavy chain